MVNRVRSGTDPGAWVARPAATTACEPSALSKTRCPRALIRILALSAYSSSSAFFSSVTLPWEGATALSTVKRPAVDAAWWK